MKEELINVQMTKSEYELFKNVVEEIEDKKKRTKDVEEHLIRAKKFKDACLERISEYGYSNGLAIYSHIRYLAGLRCGIKNNSRKGLGEKEYQNMLKILDEILQPQK